MYVNVGLLRKLSAEDLMLLNCGVGEDSWESLGQQGDPTSPSQRKSFIVRIDAEAETPMLWPSDVKSHLIGKDPDAGKDWGQEEKGATGQDGWMASLTQWTWVWASSKRWWRTGEPGVLQSMGSQSVKTERLNSILGKHISETITTINTTYIYHLQKFPMLFCILFVVARIINIRPIILTDFKINNIVFLTTGTLLYSEL